MVSAINLDRFRQSTQQLLQRASNFQVPLYSTSGNPQSSYTNGINGSSSFTLNAQNSLPNLQVNQSNGSAAALLGNTQYLNFNPTNPGAIQVSSLDNANTNVRPFGFDLSQGALPAYLIGSGSTPTSAPEVPQAFLARSNQFAVSEGNLAALMASGEFDLPTIGLGLRVQTDGTNVTDVSVKPSAQALQARDSDLHNGINTAGIIYPNKTTTQTAAPSQSSDLGPLLGNKGPRQNLAALSQKNGLNQNPFRVLAPTPTDGLKPTPPNHLLGVNNPFQQAFPQLQAPNHPGLTVIGQHAEADAPTTRHLAAVKAKLSVNVSIESQQQINHLQELATQQLMTAAKGTPLLAERQGLIPLVTPYVVNAQAGQDIIGGADQQSTLNLSTETSEKQGSTAMYMSFGTSAGGNGQPDGNAENPNKRRKPLRYKA